MVKICPLVLVWWRVIAFAAGVSSQVVATACPVAARALEAESQQCPLAVMPVTVRISLVVAPAVVKFTVITVPLLPSGAEIILAAVGVPLKHSLAPLEKFQSAHKEAMPPAAPVLATRKTSV